MLLDAAHIVEDRHELLGQPLVRNGIPLSKIHHAAFDAHLIGIDPDYRLHVSERLLAQKDGPMLEAIKGCTEDCFAFRRGFGTSLIETGSLCGSIVSGLRREAPRLDVGFNLARPTRVVRAVSSSAEGKMRSITREPSSRSNNWNRAKLRCLYLIKDIITYLCAYPIQSQPPTRLTSRRADHGVLLRTSDWSSKRYADADPVRFANYWSDARRLHSRLRPSAAEGVRRDCRRLKRQSHASRLRVRSAALKLIRA